MYTKCLLAYIALTAYLFPYALLWKVHFIFTSVVTYARIRDKAFEPRVDELSLFDKVLQNPTIAKYFNKSSFYIIDYDQEYVPGLDHLQFPEFKQYSARFFNVDTNTTEGFYAMGDVESGATMRVMYKTMPYSSTRTFLSDPFLVYDLRVEINDNGNYIKEVVIDEQDVLKDKSIFVLWH
jgi:hypothetical protein